MDVTQLGPGLWRWTATHPKWTPDQAAGWDAEVASHSWERDGDFVLVDPLVPHDDADRFWSALEKDVARARSVHVVLTCRWHGRSAREIRARTGASVHAHVEAASAVEADVTDPFPGPFASLPGGIRAHHLPSCPGGEVALELPDAEGLIFGDAILGVRDGLRTCPTTFAAETERDGFQERLREDLRPILALPFERVLVAHGAPVLAGARDALAFALLSPPKGG